LGQVVALYQLETFLRILTATNTLQLQ
jgi:hypothetical protein